MASSEGGGYGKAGGRIWVARALVLVVFAMNVQCAVQFIVWPQDFIDAYQVEGPSAAVMVRTVGICFLMWNATYPPVIVRPARFRVLFGVVLAQQIIGLVGESLLLSGLGPELAVLSESMLRFVVFDAAGLVLLVAAFFLSRERA